MKILLWLILPICVWSSTQARRRLRRDLMAESLQVGTQLESTTAGERKEKIPKSLVHLHDVESNGLHPKSNHDETETTEELIQRYLQDPRQSLTSKGGRIRNMNQPGTLGVHGGRDNDTVDEKKSKIAVDTDEDVPSHKHNDKTTVGYVVKEPSIPPSLSPFVNETLPDDADFSTQKNIVGEVTLVAVTLEHAAFLYERTSSETPSPQDLSRLEYLTHLVLLETFQHIFTNITSAGYISMDISEYTVLREDFVDFQVNVYFNGDSASIPDAQQLMKLVMEDLTPGSQYYNLYVERLKQDESPVLSSTRGFIFVASKDEIDLILNNKVPTANPSPMHPNLNNNTSDASSANGKEATNHLIPLIILGLFFVGTAAWFSYRRKVHAQRPQRGHNLMKLLFDDSTGSVTMYKTPIYADVTLNKAPAKKDKDPTMGELGGVSIGDVSGSFSPFHSALSPLSTHGLTARSMRSIVRGLKKWTSGTDGGSSIGSSSRKATDSLFLSTTVSTHQDDNLQTLPLEPVIYGFDGTPNMNSKADVRFMQGAFADKLNIKRLYKRPIATSTGSFASKSSLTMPKSKTKDLMVDTSMECQIEEDRSETAWPSATECSKAGTKKTSATIRGLNPSEVLLEDEERDIVFPRKNLGYVKSQKEYTQDGSEAFSKEQSHKSELLDPSDLPQWMENFKEMGFDKHID